jgi:hypothetical protein
LPKRFAEKIESKFSEARRERGSAAGCVTDEQRRIGGFRPISPEQFERSEPTPNQRNQFFRQRFLAKGLIATLSFDPDLAHEELGNSGKHDPVTTENPRPSPS